MTARKGIMGLLPTLLCILLIIGNTGCGSSSSPESEKKGAWYYESDFLDNPLLTATPQDVVLLDIPPRADSEPPQIFMHEIPFAFEKGGLYVFCLDTEDGVLTSLQLVDEGGKVALELNEKTRCLHATLAPGQYTKRIFHDSTRAHSSRSSVAFMHLKGGGHFPKTTSALETVQSSPPPIPSDPAYGALILQNGPYAGNYLVTTETESKLAGMSFKTLKAASLDTDKDLFSSLKHLYSFKNIPDSSKKTHLGEDTSPVFFGQFEFLSWNNPGFTYWEAYCETDPQLCVPNQDHPFNTSTVAFPVFDNIEPITAYLEAKDGGLFSIWTSSAYIFIHDHTSIYPEENGIFYYTDYAKDGSPPTVFKTEPRFRFYEDGSDVGELQDGEAAIFEGPNYSGRAWVIKVNSSSFDDMTSFEDMTLLPITQFASIKVKGDFTNLMLYNNRGLDSWAMTIGMDMAELDSPIAGSEIGSLRLFNAMKYFISNRECEHCYLVNADLSKLNLDKVDLSYANLLQATLQGSSLKKATLASATLGGVTLDDADLDGANLSSALLNGQTDPYGTHIPAASAAGAFLRNTNLQYADLSGVNFSSANLYGTLGSGACKPDDKGFTESCACASHTTINVSTFTNAYLANLDMSNAVITGGDFSNAMLLGATLSGATLQMDNKTGQRVLLSGAFLQGADFTNAKVSGVSFKNAYVDLNGGVCLLFKLAPEHLNFPGYWGVAADGECTMVGTSQSTNIENLATGSQDTCPDGQQGPCSTDDRWANPATYVSPQIFGSCFDNPLVCTIDWSWMDSGN